MGLKGAWLAGCFNEILEAFLTKSWFISIVVYVRTYMYVLQPFSQTVRGQAGRHEHGGQRRDEYDMLVGCDMHWRGDDRAGIIASMLK